MPTMDTLTSSTAADTIALGSRVAGSLKGGENLCLVGPLGSGKTAFVQGLAAGLGLTEPVKSPTFTYLREYDLPLRSTRLAHFDLYRLPDRPTHHDLASIELLERVGDPDVITAIEWADKALSWLPGGLVITFQEPTPGRREIVLPKKLLNGEMR